MGKGTPETRCADEALESLIVVIRDRRVIIDVDLARLYGATTQALNQAVKRNVNRFPDDFAFRLSAGESADFRSRYIPASSQVLDLKWNIKNRSQVVTGSQKHRERQSRPFAFTEHGALMAANVLRSERAVHMSIYVIRAFVRLRNIYRKLLPLLQPPPDPPKRRIGFHTDSA